MMHGLIFNLQKYSVHDGPGIRTTVFLKGCPLCCAWCHNPESRSATPEIIVNEGRCLVCGQCRTACPQASPAEARGPLDLPGAECQWCGACVAACPTEARQMIGRRVSVDEVMVEVLKDRIFYDESNGGVTFSGGEPLRQPEFLLALLKACRDQGIHTAIDTCGVAGTDDLLACAPLTGLFLYDLKFMDEARHLHYTGVSNRVVLAHLQALARIHPCIWLRVPIIPGINDDRPNLEATAQLARSLPAVRQVNLLPYHPIGAPKFKRLGHRFPLEGLAPPSADQMAQARAIFLAAGLVVQVGG